MADDPAEVAYLIPFGAHGLPGPLCRVLREEKDRYYVALDEANGDSNVRGVEPLSSDPNIKRKNLFVPKANVMISGPKATNETQQRLVDGTREFDQVMKTKSSNDKASREILVGRLKQVVDEILSGGESNFSAVDVVPAGCPEERVRCLGMAARLTGGDFDDVVAYLRARAGASTDFKWSDLKKE